MADENIQNSAEESISDGIPEVSFTLSVSDVVQAPIDDTLSISGQAADAKAVGDAIAAAKSELEDEISEISTDISQVAATLFPVGAIYVSVASTAPAFGSGWTWEEILIPANWGDLEDGTRSYTAGASTGNLHFWRRTA